MVFILPPLLLIFLHPNLISSVVITAVLYFNYKYSAGWLYINYTAIFYFVW